MKAAKLLQRTRLFPLRAGSLSRRLRRGQPHRRPLSTTRYNDCSLRSLTAEDRAAFYSMMDHVTDDSAVLNVRNKEWTRHYQGEAELVLQPDTVDQVADVLRYCHEQRLAVVPQGGQTGLVGGGVATGGAQVILSLDRMHRIEGLDATTGVLTCQAGCVLQTVQDHAADHNYLVPIDLGAKGSCQIGGNLSTNAGGQYYYRYGSLAANVLGLQVVLADGRVLDLNYSRPNRKDNTGYKLHQVFLGAEGTLGIITGVALSCAPLPASQQTALVACETYAQVLHVLAAAHQHLGEIVAAMEFMDQTVVRLILKHDENHRIPLVNSSSQSKDGDDDAYPYYLLVETHGSHVEHDQEKMQNFLDVLMGDGHVVDGVLAQDESQRQDIWAMREAANPTFIALGYGYKYDISVPVAEWDDFCTDMRDHLTQTLGENDNNDDVPWTQGNWGHILDGNLHWNLAIPGRDTVDPVVLEHVEQPLLRRVLQRRGSISAEHGVGQSKKEFLPLVHSEATLQTMRELKHLWDPHGILNPGKVLPS